MTMVTIENSGFFRFTERVNAISAPSLQGSGLTLFINSKFLRG